MKTEELLEKLYGDRPVKVIHGINDGLFNIAGMTVASLRESLTDAFNLPVDVLAFVNGEQVEPSCRLLPNDTVEFVEQYGEKSILDPEEKAQLDRIEAMLTRLFVNPSGENTNGITTTSSTTNGDVIYGSVQVNRNDQEATVDGKTYPLDLVQIEVLSCLVARKGELVTRKEMRASSRILKDEQHLERIIKALKNKVKPLSPLIDSSPRGYRLLLPEKAG